MPLPQSYQDQSAAQAPPKIDAHDLRNYLDRFQKDCYGVRDVEHRWLASYAEDLKTMAFHVKAGNHETIKTQVDAFRLTEIAAERKTLADRDALLEKEALGLTTEKK
jgi:hypothetical protein